MAPAVHAHAAARSSLMAAATPARPLQRGHAAAGAASGCNRRGMRSLAVPAAAPRAPRRCCRGRLRCSGSASFDTQPSNGCPYTATRAALSQLLPGGGSSGASAPAGSSDAPPPAAAGPTDPLSYVADLLFLATAGIEAASLRFARRYGDLCRFPNPVRLGGAAAWTFLASPALLEHVCATRGANYTARFLPDAYAYATRGLGVLGSQGAYNRAQRRLCGAPFAPGAAAAAAFADTAVARTEALGDVWRARAANATQQDQNGETIRADDGAFTADVAVHMQRLLLDVIGVVAFSHDFKQVEAMRLSSREEALPSDALLEHINKAQEVMGSLFITPLSILRALSAVRAPNMVSLEGALRGMHAEVAPIIAARRAHLAAAAEAAPAASAAAAADAPPPAASARDLLDALLSARSGDGLLSDEEVWEDVHDVLGAGHETTATAVTAALHALAAHPHIAAELDAHLAAAGLTGPASRRPTSADVASGTLWYAAAIVKEALRLYPPIPLFPRVAASDDTLPGGAVVRAGEVVFMSAFTMGRLPSLWGQNGATDATDATRADYDAEDEVLRFDPMRFTAEAEAARHRFAYVPFGAGPRMCLGAGFALTSATLVLATLAARFRFALPPGGAAPRTHAERLLPYAYDITLHFPGGVPLRITPKPAAC
jgi:cytochrome P450